VFVTGRVVIGFGLAAFLMTSMITVQEIAHPRSRGFVAQSWNSYYIIGLVIAGFTTFGTSYMTGSWSWRIPYILQVPLALYVLIGVQFIPESPRWLQSRGRLEEAFAFLVEYHGNGDANDELVLFEYEEIKETLRAEQEAKAEKWSTILKTPGGRKRLGLAALMPFLTNVSDPTLNSDTLLTHFCPHSFPVLPSSTGTVRRFPYLRSNRTSADPRV
jgi:MFS family permease